MAAFTDQKRALHDYIAGTCVVRIKEIGQARKAFVIMLGVLPILLIPIGIVAAVILPQFMGMKKTAGETMTRASLAEIRSALAIYNQDNARYPENFTALVGGGKYLTGLSAARTPPYHPDSAAVSFSLDDAGGWYYDNNPTDGANFGTIHVNCTHTDSRGTMWSSY